MAISRRGSTLVVSRATTALPAWCVKCGAPGTTSLKQVHIWHSPSLYLTIFLCSPIGYILLASVFGKKMPMIITLCRKHAVRRLLGLVAGPLLLLGAIPLGMLVGRERGVYTAIAAILVGLVLLVVGSNTIRPIGMSDQEAVYTGVGDGFLGRLGRP